MWFWIIVAIAAGLFAIFCIAVGVVMFIHSKKNPKETTEIYAKTPVERELEILEKMSKIRNRISAKMEPLKDKMNNLIDRRMENVKQIHTMLEGYISALDGQNVDSDFAELLSIYDKNHNLRDDKYLCALQRCKDRGLTETKKLCNLTDESKRLEAEYESVKTFNDEWYDVYMINKRDVWSNPECEELFNQLYALENDEVYKERKEKSKKWQKYLLKSIVASRGTKGCYLGREGNDVAIWNADDFEGQVISIDDIMYFQVSENTTTNTYTSSSGKASKLGTAIDEAIWGTAAATASAMQKSQQSTTTYTTLSKKAKVYFKYELGIEPLEVYSNRDVDKLIAMMPEKQK